MRTLQHWLVIIGLILGNGMLGAVSAQAQSDDLAWVQIESYTNVSQVQTRAAIYASGLDDVAAFQMNGGWYAVVIGPYTRADANQVLRDYRAQGLIPRDSFLTTTAALRQQVFPFGVDLLNTGLVPQAPETDVEDTAAREAEPAPQPIDETPAQARRSEQLLSRDERKDLQIALQWSGFYNSAIDGAFGRGTRASMAAWQVTNGFDDTGVLTTAQRRELLRQYNAVFDGMDLTLITDTRAGIEMQVPRGVVVFDRYDYPFAKFAASGDLPAQVLMISQTGGQATLAGLYDVLQTLEVVPLDGARSLKQGSFTILGQNSNSVSYTEATARNGEIKGFMLVWPAKDEARRTRILARMRDSFERIDGILDSTSGDNAAQSLDLLAGLQIRTPRLSRSGFFVNSTGDVVTTIDVVQNCTQITMDEDTRATLIATDAELGLAVIRPQSRLAPRATAGFADRDARLLSDVALSGYSYEGVLGAPTVTFGTLSDLKGLRGEPEFARLTVETLTGDAGGPVLDATGALLGMVLPRPDSAGGLPSDVTFVSQAKSLSGFLDAQSVAKTGTTSADPLAPEDISALARDMTVLVSCWD
ncbi:MAG: trypsin-like peptidase domain-containing protein [Pseudomonadota bacterium]